MTRGGFDEELALRHLKQSNDTTPFGALVLQSETTPVPPCMSSHRCRNQSRLSRSQLPDRPQSGPANLQQSPALPPAVLIGGGRRRSLSEGRRRRGWNPFFESGGGNKESSVDEQSSPEPSLIDPGPRGVRLPVRPHNRQHCRRYVVVTPEFTGSTHCFSRARTRNSSDYRRRRGFPSSSPSLTNDIANIHALNSIHQQSPDECDESEFMTARKAS